MHRATLTALVTATALGGLLGATVAGTAGAASAAPTSASFSFTATGAAGSGSSTLTGHGQVDFAASAASATLDIPAGALGGLAGSALGGGGQVQVVVSHGTVYVGGPLVSSFAQGKQWVSVPLSALDHGASTAAAAGRLAGAVGDVAGLVSSARADGATVASAPVGSVAGAATAYVVTVKGHHAGTAAGAAGLPVTLWADGAGRLVQASTTVSGGADHGTVTVDLSGYNAPVSISAPDAASVSPLPAGLVQGALGTAGLGGAFGGADALLGLHAPRHPGHRKA